MPDVSVIIAAFNAEGVLGEAIESALAQRGDFEAEIIVVDDASTDGTADAIGRFGSRVSCLRRQWNGGPGTARNDALTVASGRYVAVLDADDRWAPDYLATALDRLDRSGADIFFTDAILFGTGPHSGRLYSELYAVSEPFTVARIARGATHFFGASTYRRTAVVAAGGWKPGLRVAEDFDLWLRLLLNGCRVAYEPRPLYHYRRTAGSASSDVESNSAGVAEVCRQLAQDGRLSDDERAALDSRVMRHAAESLLVAGKRALRRGRFADAYRQLSTALELGRFGGRRRVKVELLLALLNVVRWLH